MTCWLLFVQALTEYWNNLPEEHKDTLFSMREEDFVAELDAHMKYQLKVHLYPCFLFCSLHLKSGVMEDSCFIPTVRNLHDCAQTLYNQ